MEELEKRKLFKLMLLNIIQFLVLSFYFLPIFDLTSIQIFFQERLWLSVLIALYMFALPIINLATFPKIKATSIKLPLIIQLFEMVLFMPLIPLSNKKNYDACLVFLIIVLAMQLTIILGLIPRKEKVKYEEI